MMIRRKWLRSLLLSIAVLFGFFLCMGMVSADAYTTFYLYDDAVNGRYVQASFYYYSSNHAAGAILTLSGNGVIPTNQAEILAEHGIAVKDIKFVYINKGIREIDVYAFSAEDKEKGFSGLQDVYIPSSVTKIGRYAFNKCNLTKAVFTDGISNLKTVGTDAFNKNCGIHIENHNGTEPTVFGNNYTYIKTYTWAQDYSSQTAEMYHYGNLKKYETHKSTSETTYNCLSTTHTTVYKVRYAALEFMPQETTISVTARDPGPHAFGDPVYYWADDCSTCSASHTCTLCGYTEWKYDYISECVRDSSSCFWGGIQTYQVVFPKAFGGTVTKEVTVAPHHRYGNPEYSWADDHSTCTASHKCSLCGFTETEKATATCKSSFTCISPGYNNYTATFKKAGFQTQTDSVFVMVSGDEHRGPAVHHDELQPIGDKAGNIEYWTCGQCGTCCTDEALTQETTADAVKTYNITWMPENGDANEVTVWQFGAVPIHADPVKTSATGEQIPFAGWNPTPSAVTGAATYTAAYHNPAVTHTLMITYLYADNTRAAEPHTETLAEGAAYSVASPEISGFTPDQAAVAGNMGTADVNVTVTYAENSVSTNYTVTVTDDGHGTGAASPESGVTGTEVTLTASPAEGYRFKEWQVISGNVTVTENKFTIGTSNVKIRATFETIPAEVYTVIVVDGTGSGNFEAGTAITSESTTAQWMDKPVEIHEIVEQHPLDTVPEELKEIYGTIEELRQAIMLKMEINGLPVTKDHTKFYDVELLVSFDGGRTWTKATEENFPDGGLPVILAYPEGTNAKEYDFAVSHVFTLTSQRLGTVAGEIETPVVTKTEKGLNVTLRGLSPVAVSWAEKGSEVTPTATPASTPAPTLTPTLTLTPTPTLAPTPTPTPVPKPTPEPKKLPQTGDNANLPLWFGLILLGLLGLCGLTVVKYRK